MIVEGKPTQDLLWKVSASVMPIDGKSVIESFSIRDPCGRKTSSRSTMERFCISFKGRKRPSRSQLGVRKLKKAIDEYLNHIQEDLIEKILWVTFKRNSVKIKGIDFLSFLGSYH